MIVSLRAGAIAAVRLGLIGFIGLVGSGLLACGAERPHASPVITAQGFDLAEARPTRLGETPELRVRIEAVSGLDALVVGERSYEVDLAQSPEPAHFPLFGLSRRVWSKKDVTLDFGPYVAEKLRVPGEYEFAIAVTDRKHQTAEATLRVLVTSDATPEGTDPGVRARDGAASGAEGDPASAPADERAAPTNTPAEATPPVAAGSAMLQAADFQLQRVGSGRVASDHDFGVTWKTIESVLVVIRLSGREDTDSRFTPLDPDAFARARTQADLAELLRAAAPRPQIELTAANDAAAGAVFAIEQPTARFLLRADHSETRVSDVGTTVTLTGRYKH